MAPHAALLYLLHVVHLAIILFCLFGWLLPPARPWHLLMCALIVASWFGVGLWKGWGYCLVTDIQWRLLRRLGRPVPHTGYVPMLWQRLTGMAPDARRVDRITEWGFYLCSVVSLWVNREWLRSWL